MGFRDSLRDVGELNLGPFRLPRHPSLGQIAPAPSDRLTHSPASTRIAPAVHPGSLAGTVPARFPLAPATRSAGSAASASPIAPPTHPTALGSNPPPRPLMLHSIATRRPRYPPCRVGMLAVV